jgi:hypothetical protein
MFAVLVYYWIPLTNAGTSVRWDAVDVHYFSQKYFADRVLDGDLPFWTPYIFSGFPFLADPQVGAWYPPNWPFFLAGITPGAIEAELGLHALLAFFGAFLLFGRLAAERRAALAGALFYAFSGFFAEHSSHVGMFSTAALLPWLVLAFDLAVEGRAVSNTILAGLAGGVMILAGHFQTSIYAFAALALFGAARAIERPKTAVRIASILAATAVIAVLLSAVQTLPGLELTRNSIRSAVAVGDSRVRVLDGRGGLNLVSPNATQVFDHPDGSGITDAQYYLYSGLLLLPLAVVGAWRGRSVRIAGLLLVLPTVWYMLGPDGFLYRVVVRLPGFSSIRAPVHMWFVAVLGLALLASAGTAWVLERWNERWLAPALLAVIFLDLFYWNSFRNPLAYARYSFTDLYGSRVQLAREKVVSTQPPGTRFSMPDRLTVFGPFNHPLDLELETTYGYNPLELLGYAQYSGAAAGNPKLMNGLNVSRTLDPKIDGLVANAGVLPRAYFARRVVKAADEGAALRELATLDPAEAAVVTGAAPAVASSGAVSAVAPDGEQGYRIRYRSSSAGLLKLSIPHFPGWTATVDGRTLDILRVDHALMGVEVPPGDKELVLRFHPTWFGAGAVVSLATLMLCSGGWVWAGRRFR